MGLSSYSLDLVLSAWFIRSATPGIPEVRVSISAWSSAARSVNKASTGALRMWLSIRALSKVGVFALFSQRETWAVFRCPRRLATSFWESCCAVRYRQRRLVTARFGFDVDRVTRVRGIYKEILSFILGRMRVQT